MAFWYFHTFVEIKKNLKYLKRLSLVVNLQMLGMRSWGKEGIKLEVLILLHHWRVLNTCRYMHIKTLWLSICRGHKSQQVSWQVSSDYNYSIIMHHGHAVQQWHCKHFSQQMSAQQVSIELMLVEICTSHKNLGHQPVVLRIGGEKDGIVSCWSLFKLQEKARKRGSSFSPLDHLPVHVYNYIKNTEL